MYFQKKKKNNTLSPLEVFFKRADGSERQLRIVLVYFHKNYDNKLMRNIYFVDALFHCISCAMFTIAICMYVHIWMYVFGMWQYLGTKWLVNCTLTPMYVGSAIKATKQKHKVHWESSHFSLFSCRCRLQLLLFLLLDSNWWVVVVVGWALFGRCRLFIIFAIATATH